MFATLLATTPIIVSAATTCDLRGLATIERLQDQGRLELARERIDAELSDSRTIDCRRIWLHLRKARILDRIGLHTYARPVTAALVEIESAAGIAKSSESGEMTQAEIQYARAYYHYRAEMSGRVFELAQQALDQTIALAQPQGPSSLLADATHLAGLIRLFQHQIDSARELFDQSLAIDQKAGERLFFVGEYHRHVALAYVFEGNWEAALPHYERSHRARRDNGQVDASLFSALSLGDALRRVGSPDRAVEYYRYALETSRQIASPLGRAQASMRMAQVAEQTGDDADALRWYREAYDAARAINHDVLSERALAAIARINA